MGKLLDQFRSLARKLVPTEADTRAAMQEIGETWAEEVKKRLPPSLRAGVRWEQQNAKKGTLVIPMVAFYRDKGTKPHIIRPRNKKALAFAWGHPNAPHAKSSGGKVGPARYVFGSVRHPGQKAKPFLDEAWESPRVQAAIKGLGNKLISRMEL